MNVERSSVTVFTAVSGFALLLYAGLMVDGGPFSKYVRTTAPPMAQKGSYMTLRRELQAPAIDPSLLTRLATMIDEIANIIEHGKNAEWAVTEFNKLTRRQYGVQDFRRYWQASSAEEFARKAARPAPGKVPDMTRSDLVEIVHLIVDSDVDMDYYLDLLKANVPHPNVEDLLFEYDAEDDPSAEEIVGKALTYRPFAV